jgi:hypothetical protein
MIFLFTVHRGMLTWSTSGKPSRYWLFITLWLSPRKCVFGQTEVDYLGHLITVDGVKVDPHKITAMQTWPSPKTITELRGFLGLTGYYRKFVKNYGLIAKPLTQLLKKGQFGWGPEAVAAFDQLKVAMATTPVLGLPNFSDIFVLKLMLLTKGLARS